MESTAHRGRHIKQVNNTSVRTWGKNAHWALAKALRWDRAYHFTVITDSVAQSRGIRGRMVQNEGREAGGEQSLVAPGSVLGFWSAT